MKEIKALYFYTRNNKYVFDGVTGTVVPVDDLLLDSIIGFARHESTEELEKELIQKYNDNLKVKAAVAYIDSYYKNTGGFYIDPDKEIKKWRKSKNVNNNIVRQLHDAGYMQQLILNITEDCNMRCKYCYLSEIYDFTRNRTVKKMESETAVKAIDIFLKNLKKIKKFNPGKHGAVSFYGGEALMNFSLIRDCIDYINKNSPVSIEYTLTTNGTLLYGEVLDYLVENNVNIIVSLDGSKENHNRNRIFGDETGTYDIIMKNIIKFLNKYPNYKKLFFAGVYDYGTNLQENIDFFKNTTIPRMGFLSQVTDKDTDYYKRFTETEINNFTNQYNLLKENFIESKIKNTKISTYLDMLFLLPLASVLLRLRGKDKRIPILPFTGTCIPGMKISVRVDGTYDICEKINNTMPIGDVIKGFSYNNIAQIIKNYNTEVADKCYKCPINRQCSVCFAVCAGNEKFDKPNCNNYINSFIFNLSVAYTILEDNPAAFDQFNFKDDWMSII